MSGCVGWGRCAALAPLSHCRLAPHVSHAKQCPLASSCRSNVLVAFNALLHCLGSTGELTRALGVYGAMARAGPRPDVVTFNTLLAAAAGRGDVRAAMRIFSDMVDADVVPTQRTCGALLHCYAKARDAPSARKVFDSMAQLGIRPNLRIYTSLIDACVQARSPQWTQVRHAGGVLRWCAPCGMQVAVRPGWWHTRRAGTPATAPTHPTKPTPALPSSAAAGL